MNAIPFKILHQQSAPLIICNVWDVASANAAHNNGFNAMGTSSAAIASMLGYADGEQMTFDELLFIVKRIISCSTLPLSVDIEAGYSQDPLVTAAYIKSLAEIGVVGINIEDSKVNGERKLLNANDFTRYLSAIKHQLNNEQVDVFINVRTDVFLLGTTEPIIETQKRAKLYQAAGADGLFIPCITKSEDIKAIVNTINLPINVMCMPDLPDFEVLGNLGVKRISMGNFLFDKMYSELDITLKNLLKNRSFTPIFS